VFLYHKGALKGILAPIFDYWVRNHPLLVDAVRAAEEDLAGNVGCSSKDILFTLPASNATEIRDANIYILRKNNSGKFSIVPLTGHGNSEEPGQAVEYPSTLLKPIRIKEEDSDEERLVTLSSFAVMERARIRMFAAVSRMEKAQISNLQQEFAKLCTKGVRVKNI